MHFIFLHRGIGLFPHVLVPPTFSKELKEQRKSAYEVDLDSHELAAWLAPLSAHKDPSWLERCFMSKLLEFGEF